MIPTARMVVDIGHKCNANCLHCYHKHEIDRDEKPFKTKKEIISEVEAGFFRGCNYVDFTGGEPTICQYLPEIIREIRDNMGIKSCVITNALSGKNTVEKFISAGVDDWLISVHGMNDTHDNFVQFAGARDRQIRFIEQLRDAGMTFRANFCMTKHNQNEIVDVAEWLLNYPVRIVNFINFNPHHGWSKDKHGTIEMIADFSIVQNKLESAITLLEKNNVGVNVRYYPMCRIDEKYRRCVCNDLHVTFDPYEWDYDIPNKKIETHVEWAFYATSKFEVKSYPCHACELQYICGGINKCFFDAVGSSYLSPIKDSGITDKYDFYHYRADNILTLEAR